MLKHVMDTGEGLVGLKYHLGDAEAAAATATTAAAMPHDRHRRFIKHLWQCRHSMPSQWQYGCIL